MSGRLPSCQSLLFSLAVLCACALPEPAKAACELRVGWDDWPPYITRENGQFRGVEYDLMQATAEAADCTLDLWQVPWERALRMLEAGELDLLYGAGYTAERAQFARFSVPYRQERFVLVTKAEAGDDTRSLFLADWLEAEGAASRPRAIGIFRGNFYGEEIEHILRHSEDKVTLVEVNQNEQLTGMLEAGRLDGYIVEDGVAQMQLEASPFPINRYVIEEQTADPLHYMFSLQVTDDVVERFNSAIRARQSREP